MCIYLNVVKLITGKTLWLRQVFVFQISLCNVWIHNDSMYVSFGGIRDRKTWSKSISDHAMEISDNSIYNITKFGKCIPHFPIRHEIIFQISQFIMARLRCHFLAPRSQNNATVSFHKYHKIDK